MNSWGQAREVEKPRPIKPEAEEACEHLRAAEGELYEAFGNASPLICRVRGHMKRAADVLEAAALGKRSVERRHGD